MYKESNVAILLDDPHHNNHRGFITFKELEEILDALGDFLTDRTGKEAPAVHSIFWKLQDFSPFKNV